MKWYIKEILQSEKLVYLPLVLYTKSNWEIIMANRIQVNKDGKGIEVRYDKLPTECVFCHKDIVPEILFASLDYLTLSIICKCPKCCKIIVGAYEQPYNQYGDILKNADYRLKNLSVGNFKKQNFSDIIKKISPLFVDVYNRAIHAETLNMKELLSFGYFKSIDCLLRDYLIYTEKITKEKKQEYSLRELVEAGVNYPSLSDHMKQSKWIDYDLNRDSFSKSDDEDMKLVIGLLIQWIEMESKISC
ncbi:hypothetical protein M2101_000730 [Parabacteroides sp. PM5-20]|uniref:hypothetical protein n=1 Tax=Parabacteroides sp. PM5-20 TaxID=2940527 RepID=UPI0024765363|nr:hypothetical protein [Parabacteroides sp. PM5-20]MDH6534072.1 hypothetical protein [Parabacteroides sp. PM5-20]